MELIDAAITPFIEQDFMRRALIASVLAVICASTVGVWVVVRGLSFMGDAMAHGIVPGVAVALVLGFNPLLGAALAAGVMIAGLSWVSRRSSLPQDASIGLMFVGMLALGVVIISRQDTFEGDLTTLLFGDPLAAQSSDIILALVVTAVILVVLAMLHRPFMALAFSQDFAALTGMRPGVANTAMLGLVAATVIVSFQTVGTLLVFALLVAPPATAALVATRVPMMMLVACALGTVAAVTGLWASLYADLPAAAVMATVAVGQFFVVGIGRDLVRSRRTVAAG